MPIFYSGGKQGKKNLEYWLNLLGTDWGNDLSEDKRNDAANELIRILGERYSSDGSKDDALHEEMEKMKFENAGKLNIKRRAAMDLFKMY